MILTLGDSLGVQLGLGLAVSGISVRNAAESGHAPATPGQARHDKQAIRKHTPTLLVVHWGGNPQGAGLITSDRKAQQQATLDLLMMYRANTTAPIIWVRPPDFQFPKPRHSRYLRRYRRWMDDHIPGLVDWYADRLEDLLPLDGPGRTGDRVHLSTEGVLRAAAYLIVEGQKRGLPL